MDTILCQPCSPGPCRRSPPLWAIVTTVTVLQLQQLDAAMRCRHQDVLHWGLPLQITSRTSPHSYPSVLQSS
eukprot:3477196-Rhodomonas_salina.1